MGYDVRLIELQLAHADQDQVRAAYKRETHLLRLDERRKMMQHWSDYLDQLKSGAKSFHYGLDRQCKTDTLWCPFFFSKCGLESTAALPQPSRLRLRLDDVIHLAQFLRVGDSQTSVFFWHALSCLLHNTIRID